jgi:general secretion pathway protein K
MRGLQRQRGVAVVTALLLTTLAISIVASLFWQQQVQVRSMENQRLHLQTKWILRGALDWSTLVLRQDGYDHPNYTWLTHVWATPLAETRLDQYIERERVEGETFDASLSGNITDACSRYNLTNLAKGGKVTDDQVKVFARLLQNVQVDSGMARRVAQVLAQGQPKELTQEGPADGTSNPPGSTPPGSTPPGSTPPTGEGDKGLAVATGGAKSVTTMKLLEVDDLLAVPGFNQAVVDKLRPFVTVLPDQAPVNVNTAPAEVLSAITMLSMSEANALVVRRKQAPWKDIAQFATEAHLTDPDTTVMNVKSDWFLVDTRIRLDRAALNAQSLIYRPTGGMIVALTGTAVKWTREY